MHDDHGVGLRRFLNADNEQQRDRQNDEDGGQIHDAVNGSARHHVPGTHGILRRQVNAKLVQKMHQIRRPADRNGGRAHRIFQHQIPADDPGQQFAHGRVGVRVGAARDRDHGGELAVAHAREGAAERRDDEGENHRRSGVIRGDIRVSENSPAPMIAPIPSATRLPGPSVRFRLCSPPSVSSHDAAQWFDWRIDSRDRAFFLSPEIVNRNAQQHNAESRKRVVRFVQQQQNLNQTRRHNVDGGQHRIAHGAVGPLHIRPRAAQDEQSRDRQRYRTAEPQR